MSCRRHRKLSSTGSSKRIVIPTGSIDPNRPSVIEIPLRNNEYTIYEPSRQFEHSLNASRTLITPATTPPAPAPVPAPAHATLCNSCGQDLSHSMLGNLNRTTPNYPPTSTPIRATPVAPPPLDFSMIPPQYHTPASNNSSHYRSIRLPNQQQQRYTPYQQSHNYSASPASPAINYHSDNCPLNQSRHHPYQYQQHRNLSPYFQSPNNGNITKQEISELIDEKFKTLLSVIQNNQNDNSVQGANESNPVKRRLFHDADNHDDEGGCNDKTCNSGVMKKKEGASKQKK